MRQFLKKHKYVLCTHNSTKSNNVRAATKDTFKDRFRLLLEPSHNSNFHGVDLICYFKNSNSILNICCKGHSTSYHNTKDYNIQLCREVQPADIFLENIYVNKVT